MQAKQDTHAGSGVTRKLLFGVATIGVTKRFEWDAAKNLSNIKKHGLDLADAEEMFAGVFLALPDTREDYGEKRWRGIGTIRGRIAYVVFAESGPEIIRIISVRKATPNERKQYEEAIQNGLEAN